MLDSPFTPTLGLEKFVLEENIAALARIYGGDLRTVAGLLKCPGFESRINGYMLKIARAFLVPYRGMQSIPEEAIRAWNHLLHEYGIVVTDMNGTDISCLSTQLLVGIPAWTPIAQREA